jgi:hypothetical protein
VWDKTSRPSLSGLQPTPSHIQSFHNVPPNYFQTCHPNSSSSPNPACISATNVCILPPNHHCHPSACSPPTSSATTTTGRATFFPCNILPWALLTQRRWSGRIRLRSPQRFPSNLRIGSSHNPRFFEPARLLANRACHSYRAVHHGRPQGSQYDQGGSADD